MKRQTGKFMINLGLLFSGFAMAFSGLLIQIKYHMGHHGSIAVNDSALGISYFGWSDIHKLSVITLSVFLIFHIAQHWKWYNTVIEKILIARNIQQIILSVVFILVALTGYIPWLIDLMKGDELTRKAIIELHDKLAIVLLIYLVMHIIKRRKWFINLLDHSKDNRAGTREVRP